MLNNSPFYTAGFKDYIDILFRRKTPYFLGLLVALIIFMVLNHFQSHLFASQSKIFVKEKSKSSPLLRDYIGTSNFSTRWPVVVDMVFNDETIGEHLPYFAGAIEYKNRLNNGDLDKPHIDDKHRYMKRRIVPYDLYHDQEISLSPYQWWMISVEMKRLGIPFLLDEDVTKTKFTNGERLRRAQWFCKNVFRPIENKTASPLKGDGGPFRMFVKDDDSADKRLIGEKIKVNLTTTPTKDDMDMYLDKFMLVDDGSFAKTIPTTTFMQETTFTTPELEMIAGDNAFFRDYVKVNVQSAMTVSGFNVAFEHDNRTLTRFVVAWTVEMIKRFSALKQYDLIDGSGDVLRVQLKQSLLKYNQLQASYMDLQKKNAEIYLSPITNAALASGHKNTAVSPSFIDVSPQSFVRSSYNNVHRVIQENSIRLKQIVKEIEKLKSQLNVENPLILTSQKIKRNEDFDKFKTNLLDLQTKRRIESYKKTEIHPHIVDLDRKIDSLKTIMKTISEFSDDETESVSNPTYEIIKKQISDLEIESIAVEVTVAELKDQEKILSEKLRQIPIVQQKLDNMSSRVVDQQMIVSTLQKSLNKVQRERELAYNLLSVDYTVNEPPKLPQVPQSKLYIHLSISFVISIAFSIAMIFVYEFTDPSIKELNDVNKFLDASVLGIIPVLEMQKDNFDEIVKGDPEKYMGD